MENITIKTFLAITLVNAYTITNTSDQKSSAEELVKLTQQFYTDTVENPESSVLEKALAKHALEDAQFEEQMTHVLQYKKNLTPEQRYYQAIDELEESFRKKVDYSKSMQSEYFKNSTRNIYRTQASTLMYIINFEIPDIYESIVLLHEQFINKQDALLAVYSEAYKSSEWNESHQSIKTAGKIATEVRNNAYNRAKAIDDIKKSSYPNLEDFSHALARERIQNFVKKPFETP